MAEPWAADIAITESLSEQLVAEQFPQLRPVQAKLIGAGWDNFVFRINQEYIFRFPRRTVAVELLETENRMLPALSKELPVPIPNPRYIGKPSRQYPYPFSGYRELPGRTPHDRELTTEQRAESVPRWAAFLRTLHAIPVSHTAQWGIPREDTIGRMDLDKRIPMFRERVLECWHKGLIEDPDALLSVTEGLPSSEFLLDNRRTLVHGDLNFRNFLVDGAGVLSGVIDWGDVHIGHPAIDLSVAYTFLPPHARNRFWAMYGEVTAEVRQLARFRAVYSNLLILAYAFDIGEHKQFDEAKRALAFATSDEP